MKKLLFAFSFLLFFTGIFADDGAEINKPKDFLYVKAVQDWKSGQADARLELNMFKAGLKLPANKNDSFNLIQRYAPYLLKDIYLSIIVDSSHRLGNYLAEGEVTLNQINEIIDKGKNTDPRFSRDLDTAIIFHSAYMHEVAKLFVKHKNAYTPKVPPSTAVSREYTGILIDARGLKPIHGEYMTGKLNPALFPKIWDTDMSLIFEKNMVNPETALKQSIVKYSNTLDESEYRDLIGTKPLRILARGIFGQNRTDPIISTTDSAQILAKPENLKLLKEGRIVIVCDDLTVSPSYPLPDERFYFDYFDIEKSIGGNEGISIDPPDIDNGGIIKIIMYDIHFVADKAEILPEDFGRIDVVAEKLRNLGPDINFIIEGHTAELYRPEEQLILSNERAQEMAKELVKRGIDASRITTEGYGATQPRAPSDTEANKAKNRRVEIKIVRQ